jgi:hypothetical protein
MRKPAKAAFDHPTARQHNKAFLSGFAADHVVAHAMEVGPLRQRSAVKPPSKIATRRLGQCVLPPSSAGSVSRSCTEAGTVAIASQTPSASTRATRLRPTIILAGS